MDPLEMIAEHLEEMEKSIADCVEKGAPASIIIAATRARIRALKLAIETGLRVRGRRHDPTEGA